MNEVKKDQKNALDIMVSVKAVLWDPKDDKFLLVQRRSTKEWGFLGGTIDGNENLEQTLKRELQEEAGNSLEYELGSVIHARRRKNRKFNKDYVRIAYLVKYNGGDIVLSDEHIKYDWMSVDEIQSGKHTKWVKESIENAIRQIESVESVERLHRCLADFDNYKKRQTQQQKEFTKYATEGVISDMLPVLDNFHAATDHIPEGEADNPWVTGIMFIQQQMDKIFEEHNVTRIEINVGDVFDPETMEAVKHHDEKAEFDQHATVKKIAQPGYKIGEKVLRPARVILNTKEEEKNN
jgi:molecular chaperone GrpE